MFRHWQWPLVVAVALAAALPLPAELPLVVAMCCIPRVRIAGFSCMAKTLSVKAPVAQPGRTGLLPDPVSGHQAARGSGSAAGAMSAKAGPPLYPAGSIASVRPRSFAGLQ